MNLQTLDFMSGYKTYTGTIVFVLSFLLKDVLTESEVVELVNQIGMVLGASLAVYGIVIKLVKTFRK